MIFFAISFIWNHSFAMSLVDLVVCMDINPELCRFDTINGKTFLHLSCLLICIAVVHDTDCSKSFYRILKWHKIVARFRHIVLSCLFTIISWACWDIGWYEFTASSHLSWTWAWRTRCSRGLSNRTLSIHKTDGLMRATTNAAHDIRWSKYLQHTIAIMVMLIFACFILKLLQVKVVNALFSSIYVNIVITWIAIIWPSVK